MSRFRPIDRQTDFLLPPSVQDWLPQSHLARYVVDVVESLDLSEGNWNVPTQVGVAMPTTQLCFCRC